MEIRKLGLKIGRDSRRSYVYVGIYWKMLEYIDILGDVGKILGDVGIY